MKNLLLGTALTVLLASCGGEEPVNAKTPGQKGEVNKTSTSKTLTVDANASVLKWRGSKIVGGEHLGVVTVKNGEVVLDNGKLLGGKATIDVASLSESVEASEWKMKLESHLKGPDFFNVDTFPTAEVIVTKVEGNKATADLTIKGQTKTIEFPITFKNEGGKVSVAAKFSIDRTDWGIVYGSGSLADAAKDNVISDDIEFDLNLVAK